MNNKKIKSSPMKVVHKKNDNPVEALLRQINPNKIVLTPDVLRRFPNCENYTDEQAKQIIETLEQFSAIVYALYADEKLNIIDNQHIISLNSQKQNNNLNNLKAA
jgi:hypothetical protein